MKQMVCRCGRCHFVFYQDEAIDSIEVKYNPKSEKTEITSIELCPACGSNMVEPMETWEKEVLPNPRILLNEMGGRG
jgi:NAD-dependent SIR2 family protein deacetylase